MTKSIQDNIAQINRILSRKSTYIESLVNMILRLDHGQFKAYIKSTGIYEARISSRGPLAHLRSEEKAGIEIRFDTEKGESILDNGSEYVYKGTAKMDRYLMFRDVLNKYSPRGSIPNKEYLFKNGNDTAIVKLSFVTRLSRYRITILPSLDIYIKNDIKVNAFRALIYNIDSHRYLSDFMEIKDLNKTPLMKAMDDHSYVYSDPDTRGNVNGLVESMHNNVLYGIERRRTAGAIAIALAKYNSDPMKNLCVYLSKMDNAKKLVSSKYPLEGVIINRTDWNLVADDESSFPASSQSRPPYQYSVDLTTFDTTAEDLKSMLTLRGTKLSLLFKIPNIYIKTSSSVVYGGDGISLGDIMLRLEIEGTTEGLYGGATIYSRPSIKGSIINSFLKQGLAYYEQERTRSYIHPHVSASGKICLGDFQKLLNIELNNLRLENIPEIVMSALENLNPQSMYCGFESILAKQREEEGVDNVLKYMEGVTKKISNIDNLVRELHYNGWNLTNLHGKIEDEHIKKVFTKSCETCGYKIIPLVVEVVPQEVNNVNIVSQLVPDMFMETREEDLPDAPDAPVAEGAVAEQTTTQATIEGTLREALNALHRE